MSKIPNKNVKGQAGGKDAGKLNRRDFLKLSIPAVGLVALGGRSCCSEVTAAPAAAAPNAVGMLYDSRKCVGCRRCEDACRRWNQLDSEYRPMDLSAKSFTMIKYIKTEGTYADKWLPTKWQCMHCIEPTCVSVCPTSALHKTADGPVLYDEGRCIGCQYCVTACPFSVPRFDWEHDKMIKKCTFCNDRQADGLEPMCSTVCPKDALTFGTRTAVLNMAAQAQAEGAFVYGKEEAGGTSWIYVSDVSFEERGLPVVSKAAYPTQSKTMLWPQLGTIAVGAVAMGAYATYLKRKKVEGEGE